MTTILSKSIQNADQPAPQAAPADPREFPDDPLPHDVRPYELPPCLTRRQYIEQFIEGQGD